MDDYISREAAMPDDFCVGVSCQECPFCDDPVKGGCKVVRFIDSIPAADVVEVRHGSWHRYSKGSGSLNGVIILSDAFQCTICKKSFWNKSDYCPSCGAKMDGKTNE